MFFQGVKFNVLDGWNGIGLFFSLAKADIIQREFRSNLIKEMVLDKLKNHEL